MPKTWLVLFATAGAGCAVVNPRAGLEDVQRLVHARAALPVSAPADEATARAVDARVAALLAAPLTPESAVTIALLNNRGLQALYQELGVPEAELAQAGLLPNPILNANVRFGLGPAGTGTELGLAQDVIGVLQIPLKKRVAAAKLAEAKLAAADGVLDVALATKAAVYRLQGAEQILELRRRVVDAAAAARRVVESQHAAGSVTDLALATERAQHEEAAADLTLAADTAAAEREDLNALLGVAGDRLTWTLAAGSSPLPTDPTPASADLEALAIAQRLDLEAARLATESERARYRLGRFYGLVPTASLGTAAHREVDGTWSVGPAFDLPIPLFDQGQAALAATSARIAAGDERTAALAIRIRADVRRARTRLEAARVRAAQYRDTIVPLAATVLAESQREYNAMLIGIFQLLQAKRDEIDARRHAIETATDYWLARTDLERAVGGVLASAAPSPTDAPRSPVPVGASAAAGDSPHAHHHHGD